MPSATTSSGDSASKKVKREKNDGGDGEGRLSGHEKRIWKAVMELPQRTATMDKIEKLFPDIRVEERSKAINSLSKKSLVSFQSSGSGSGTSALSIVALSKKEASTLGQMAEEERLVYQHIRDSGNEGIWTKFLKQRAGLHQTPLHKSLKWLEGRSFIKSVKSVKYPTRKIYMLFELTPSVELSGGPWYTDNELDSEFINELCKALRNHIHKQTQPRKLADEDDDEQPVFPVSSISSFPTVQSCLTFLKGSNITQTVLNESNVQSLLDVLVYDGDIEKIPHVRVDHSSSKRSRRDDDEWTQRKGQRDGYETQSEESEVSVASERDSDDDSDRASRKKRKRDKKRHQKKKESKRRRKDEPDSDSQSDSEDSDESEERSAFANTLDSIATVYRAVRPAPTEAGWIDVPCSHCPVFDFCQPGGPVNAEGCVYMRGWIDRSRKWWTQEGDGAFNGDLAETRIAYEDEKEEEEDVDEDAAGGERGASPSLEQGEEEVYSEGEV